MDGKDNSRRVDLNPDEDLYESLVKLRKEALDAAYLRSAPLKEYVNASEYMHRGQITSLAGGTVALMSVLPIFRPARFVLLGGGGLAVAIGGIGQQRALNDINEHRDSLSKDYRGIVQAVDKQYNAEHKIISGYVPSAILAVIGKKVRPFAAIGYGLGLVNHAYHSHFNESPAYEETKKAVRSFADKEIDRQRELEEKNERPPQNENVDKHSPKKDVTQAVAPRSAFQEAIIRRAHEQSLR